MTSHLAGMRFIGALAFLALAIPVVAQAAETAETADGHARVTLLADVESVPAGEPFRLGVRFQLDPEWHMYWHNPGQAGLATELEWKSDVVTVGSTQWPAPHRFATDDDFIVTHGYHEDVLLFAEAKARASGEVEVRVDFLVCKTDCIPGQVVLSRKIDVAEGRWVAHEALFEAAAAQVPTPLATATPHALRQDQQKLSGELTIPAAGLALLEDPRASFFVHRVPGLELVAKQATRRGDDVHFVLEGTAKKPLPEKVPAVVVLKDGKGARVGFEVALTSPIAPIAVAAAPPVVTETPPAAAVSLLSVLWLALVGGMILNLMPCVLPVLALKVSGLARMAGESRRARGAHALAFLGGIQMALLALGAIVLALRLAGTQVGWGFQFQQPVFLAIMGGLLVVLAMNAFGVFELDVGGVANDLAEKVDGTSGLRKSFGEGALAVVLATPCSAPFVGSAIGYALTAPAYVVLAVFAMLGIGLWLPFAVLAMAPGAKRILPKPGRWMLALKQGVGFTLLGAALWILWVAARSAGIDGAGRIGLFWLALAVGAWIVGFVQTRRLIALVAVGVAALGVGVATLRFDDGAAGATETAEGWSPWSDELVAQQLAEGKTVFVDFTADWCITCKVNERTAIADDQVQALVASRDISMLRADWTRPDDRIRAALTKHGRAGVPMYLVYSPERPGAPDVLPEVLTPGIVHDALDRASRND